MRLLLDENLSPNVALQLAAEGYDAVAAIHRGLQGAEDWEVMARCASEKRAVVTKNFRHFERQHSHYQARAEDHYGILIVGDWRADDVLDALRQYLRQHHGESLLNQVVYVPPP